MEADPESIVKRDMDRLVFLVSGGNAICDGLFEVPLREKHPDNQNEHVSACRKSLQSKARVAINVG